jgi:hypothetical protein
MPDRVREHSSRAMTEELDRQTVRRLDELRSADRTSLDRRLRELDREWDTERVLELGAGGLVLAGLVLTRRHHPRWWVLSATVSVSLINHAVTGWCSALIVTRRMGLRSRRELEAERYAIKTLRGDLEAPGAGDDGAALLARMRS